jgi:hypothetical protein
MHRTTPLPDDALDHCLHPFPWELIIAIVCGGLAIILTMAAVFLWMRKFQKELTEKMEILRNIGERTKAERGKLL